MRLFKIPVKSLILQISEDLLFLLIAFANKKKLYLWIKKKSLFFHVLTVKKKIKILKKCDVSNIILTEKFNGHLWH